MPEPFDLNGVWMDHGFPTRIDQTRNLLQARWLFVPYECEPRPGADHLTTDLNFEATLSGSSISGQTTTCSTSGLKMASFELSVSPDGNTLTGRWFREDPPGEVEMKLTRCLDWTDDNDLEERDRARWENLQLEEVSWYWPASFYMTIDSNGAGVFEGNRYSLTSKRWITDSGYFQLLADPDEITAGDIVIFQGANAEWKVNDDGKIVPNRRPGSKGVSHSGIATGRADEISHLWWTREVRQNMKRDGVIVEPTSAASPQAGGYGILRDTMRGLIGEFTDRNGKVYLVSPYEVWRPARVPDLSGLRGSDACDRWPTRHIVRAPSTGGRTFSP